MPTPTPAFLPDDIVNILTTIISTHITNSKHDAKVMQRATRDNDDDFDDDLDYSDDDNDSQNPSTRETLALTKKAAKQTKKQLESMELPHFMPYSLLLNEFYTVTGHGWTTNHLKRYGQLRLFLIKHSDVFCFHGPSSRVGLVSILQEKLQKTSSTTTPNNDIASPTTLDVEEYCYDNTTWLGTSTHLHKDYYNESNIDQHYETLHFAQILSQKQGHSANIDSNNQLLFDLSNHDALQIHKIPHTTTGKISNAPITQISAPTSTNLQRQGIPGQIKQSISTNTHKTQPHNHTNQHNSNDVFDHHDIDEKMKNRGCAPQTKSGLITPLYVILTLVLLYIAFIIALEQNFIQPEQISQPNTGVYNFVIASRTFARDLMRDFGFITK